jgi:hypothetical protein
MALSATLCRLSEVQSLLVVPQEVCLVAHAGQDPAAKSSVAGLLRESQRLGEIASSQTVLTDVVRGPACQAQ